MMNTIEKTQNNWGMIHADLIPSNFVFYNRESQPIDFGACGFGYYLFDLESYSYYFMPPQSHVEPLEGFFVNAQLETMNFWLGLPDAIEWLPTHIEKLASREL